VALVGNDGIIGGFAAAACAPAACDAEVQVPGTAARLPASAFRYALEQNPPLRSLAARFDSAMLAHAQQTALCNAAHTVESRICRYLLEVQDRCAGNKIPFTQGTLGQLLSVRRTTVTLVAGRLEAAGVLRCRRGYLEIIDRQELERHACECYEHLKLYMANLFAPAQVFLSSHRRLRCRKIGGRREIPSDDYLAAFTPDHRASIHHRQLNSVRFVALEVVAAPAALASASKDDRD